MRKLLLTGLATEHSFIPTPTKPAGAPSFYLVFNEGELRVEVSEQAAQVCVQALVGGQVQEEKIEEDPPQHNGPIIMGNVGSLDDDDDGVDQV